VRRGPTDRQAALAARQLHYHREKLGWIQARIRDNEDLLLLYLTRLDADAAVLPGDFRVGGDASTAEEITVEKLAPKNLHEQLALPIGERETAWSSTRGVPLRGLRPRVQAPGEPTEGGCGVNRYVERECRRCLEGVVHIGRPTELKTAPCPDCGGAGMILAFLYPKPRGRRGPWPPQGAAEGETTEKEDDRG